jgi:heme-degrading monooxygenase HmoA
MHARVIRTQIATDQYEAAMKYAREQGVPAWRQRDGFQGALMLPDRGAEKGLIVSLWDSEQNARGAEAGLARQREQASRQFGPLPVDLYEVALHLPSASAASGRKPEVARVVTTQVPAERVQLGIGQAQEQTIPAVQRQPGFGGMYLLMDRGSGKALAITLWESVEKLNANTAELDRLRGEAVQGQTFVQAPQSEVYEVAEQV